MAPLALFGIENDALNLVANLIVLSLLVVYAALVFWTYSDARRRISDPMLVGCATAASLFPFIGTIIYLIVRPPEYLDDVHERELEIAAAEARINSVRRDTCRHCDFDIEPGFLRCPSCLRRLKEPCAVCGKPLDPRWKICPYCEAEVGQAPAQPRRRERRVRPPGAAAARQPAQASAARQTQGGKPARQPAGGPAARQGEGAARQPGDGQPQRQAGAQPPRRPAKAAPPGAQGRPAPRKPRPDARTAERPPSRPPASG